jgi:predicted MPP superfamily phosphohydrolase
VVEQLFQKVLALYRLDVDRSGAHRRIRVPRLAKAVDRRWKMPFILIACIAAVGVLASLVCVSTFLPKASIYEVNSPRIPPSFDGYCIVQISDLHNDLFGPHQSRLMRLIDAAHPDLIVVTGDLVDKERRGDEHSLDLINQLTPLAPVYFATGNHEVYLNETSGLQELLERLENRGVQVLQGKSVLLRRGSEAIALAGIDDPTAFQGESSQSGPVARWERALADLRTTIESDTFAILLSHRPERIRIYANLGFDLVFTGHVHGGVLRLPFIGGIYAKNQGWLPQYTSGMYTLNHTIMIVSRGLGRGGVPFRFLNRPDIVVVRLRRG